MDEVSKKLAELAPDDADPGEVGHGGRAGGGRCPRASGPSGCTSTLLMTAPRMSSVSATASGNGSISGSGCPTC